MRGSVLDLIGVIAGLFLLFVVMITGHLFISEVSGPLAAQNITVGIAEAQQGMESWNTMFIFVALGFALAVIISAFFIETHPIFFIVSFIAFVIILSITGVITNAVNHVVEDPTLAGSVNEFPLAVTFMQNLPTYVLLVGALTLIVLYMKRGGGR